MKKVAFILIATLVLSCSKSDNCSGNYNDISQNYQTQIDYQINNPAGGIIDYRKIDILKQERDKKLANACR